MVIVCKSDPRREVEPVNTWQEGFIVQRNKQNEQSKFAKTPNSHLKKKI
jgi:hypothetical protein